MAEIAIAAAVAAAVSAASYTLSYVLAPKPKPQERGRLQGQLQVQDSSYGPMIPWILGGDTEDGSPHGIRVAGNVIYLSDIRKVEEVVPGTGGGGNGGGKGGGGGQPKERQITYYVDIGICFGTPGDDAELDLQAMFAGADLIYDVRAQSGGPNGGAYVYEGESGANTFTGATQVNNYSGASHGQEITLQNSGAVQFNTVWSNYDGVRALTIYYRTAMGVAQPVELYINGGAAIPLVLPTTNETFAGYTTQVDLVEGDNTIKIKNVGPPYNVGIDRIYCYPGPASGGNPLVAPIAPPTGVLDPYQPADPGYDPLIPPHRDDADLLAVQDQRFGYVPPENSRGEVSATLVAGGYSALRWYPGNETQEPDPLITSEFQKLYPDLYNLGLDVTPAYLGRAYAVLQNFNISKYGAVPNFTAILRNKNVRTAAQVLTALCNRSGLDVDTELDVTALNSSMVRGLAVVNRSSVKQISAETLARRFPFDWTQKNGKLTTVMRGGAAAFDVPAAHLGWKSKGGGGGENDAPQRVAVKQKLNEADLPRRVEVKGFNPARDFEIGTGSAKRQVVTSKLERTIEVNMALSLDEMREMAQRELDTAWLEERQALGISIPHAYASLVPTDVLNVNDGGTPTAIIHSMRVKEITGAIPGALEIVGVPTDAALYVLNEFAPPTYPGTTPPVPATVIGTFIDSHYLRDRESYDGRLGYYVACTSLGNGTFSSADLWRDRGAGDEFVCDFPVRATMGTTATVLSAGSTSLTVDLYADATLETFDSGEVAGGSGWIFSGREALQYTTATPVDGYTNRYLLEGLTSRGGKGTTAFINAHTAGERFVVLNQALRFVAVDLSENGVARNHKFKSAGMSLDDAAVVPYTWNVDTMLALPAPGNINAAVVLNKIRWSWDHVSDPNRLFSHYEVFRDAGLTQRLYRGDNAYFTEDLVTGTSSYPVYIVTYTKALTRSAVAGSQTFTLSAVPDVTGFTGTWDGLDGTFTWNEVSDPLLRIQGYELYNSSNVVIGFSDKPPFVLRPTTAATTIKIRAVDAMGNRSANYTSYTLTISNPAPPASAATVYDGADIVTTWPASATAGVIYYEVQDGLGNVVAARVDGLVHREKPTQGVATYTRRVFAVNRVGLKSLTYAEGTLTVPAPDPPATATGAWDGLNVRWTLTASPSPGVVAYRVRDGAGTLLADRVGLDWREKAQSGVGSYTRRFYAINSFGLVSSSYTETTFVVPNPDPPTSFAIGHEFNALLLTYAAPATLPDGLEYDLARANDGTQIIARRKDFLFRETGFAVSSRSFTRYARSINIAGKLSTWVSASNTFAAPVAPTITKDTAMARPNFLPINVATSHSRPLIGQTIVQVRASGAGSWPATTEGTSGSRRYAGAPPTINVDWDAGGAMEFRVAHIDEFSDTLADYQWSTTQTHTFPTFSDGALDPNSNFMRKANWRDPIYTGGGTITWATNFKVKWDAAIVITGLSSLVSSSGQVTIAANTSGTTLAAGEMLIAVQTLGATTASLLVVADDGTYTPPAETSNTIHRRLFKRNSDNSLATYLGVPMTYNASTDVIMDSRVLIPMLSTFDAIMFNALITNANIKDLAATKILVDVLYGRIVFADKIGSNNFVSAGSLTWTGTTGVSFDAEGDHTKTGGTNNTWDAGTFSVQSIPAATADRLTFKAGDTNKYKMAGLSTTNADASYSSINRAWYPSGDGNAYIYENGTLIGGSHGAYTTSTVFEIKRNLAGDIVYLLDGVVKRTTTDPSSGGALYVDTSMYSTGASLKTIRLEKSGQAGAGWQAFHTGLVEMVNAIISGQVTATSGRIAGKMQISEEGELVMGDDKVVLDQNGITIQAGDESINQVTWKNGSTQAATISTEIAFSGTVAKTILRINGDLAYIGNFATEVDNSSGGVVNFQIVNGNNTRLGSYALLHGAGGATFGGLLIADAPGADPTPTQSTILELRSTEGAFLPPKMTTTQRDAMTFWTKGMIIFNTTTGKHEGYDGTDESHPHSNQANWKAFF